jgi:hypothetical protein
MSVQVAKSNLTDAMKILHEKWARARQQWDDQASDDFQRQVIEPLEPRVRAACKAFDQIADLIAKARHDCADE